jgi:hypothetical protein
MLTFNLLMRMDGRNILTLSRLMRLDERSITLHGPLDKDGWDDEHYSP